MRVKRTFLAVGLALTAAAVAQPADPAHDIDCKAGAAAIERDIDLARSKGQMLRRRELAEALAEVQARCGSLATVPQGRDAQIEALEHEIRELRRETAQAEEKLRELKREAP